MVQIRRFKSEEHGAKVETVRYRPVNLVGQDSTKLTQRNHGTKVETVRCRPVNLVKQDCKKLTNEFYIMEGCCVTEF